MDIRKILEPDRVIIGLPATKKAELIEQLARRAAADTGVGEVKIAAALEARERLGSTGVGQGIALPHAQIPGLRHPYSLFARMEQSVDFDAIDGQAVDLVFLLLTPVSSGSDQMAALAAASRMLRDQKIVSRLRTATTASAIYRSLTAPSLPKHR
jgi:PTS system nitrogen regulatory IIA component